MQYADGQNWRQRVIDSLSPLGIKVFNPYQKPFINEIKEDEEARQQLQSWMNAKEYDKVAERMKQVRSDDLRLCDVSDFAIVQIIPKVASWGSAEELTTFVRMKKPIFVFIEGGKQHTPFWIMGQLPHKYIYNSLEEVLEMIKKIDSGQVEIDSKRWRLLRHEYR
jgi:hypothetical protein